MKKIFKPHFSRFFSDYAADSFDKDICSNYIQLRRSPSESHNVLWIPAFRKTAFHHQEQLESGFLSGRRQRCGAWPYRRLVWRRRPRQVQPSMAYTAAMLAWAVYEEKDAFVKSGSLNTYWMKSNGQRITSSNVIPNPMCITIRWETEILTTCGGTCGSRTLENKKTFIQSRYYFTGFYRVGRNRGSPGCGINSV